MSTERVNTICAARRYRAESLRGGLRAAPDVSGLSRREMRRACLIAAGCVIGVWACALAWAVLGGAR